MASERVRELDEKKRRRKRVARMKAGIVLFLGVWMVLSMGLTAALFVKVISLQRQINVLASKKTEKVESQTVAADNTSSAYLRAYGSTAEDNLATAEDTLKVYLTFDDGPSGNTEAILNTLDDYGIKATFFVVGREDDHSKEMYRRIVAEGHTIGLHSYSHRYSELYASLDSFAADFDRISNLIYDVTGVDTPYYRFPGGSSNQVSNVDMAQFISFLNEKNMVYYDWNVSSGDATSQAYTADELVANVMNDVVKYKTSVVLMHDADPKAATVAALPTLIESLQAQGALILPITEETTLIQHVTLESEAGD